MPGQSQLLQDLFRYRQRERRAPLEDFLTAALVGFLRTLAREMQFEFVSRLLVAPDQQLAFLGSRRHSVDHRWDIQFTLPTGKRPDIVLWGGGVPVIVIENKLWSGIRTHEVPLLEGIDDEQADDTDANVSLTVEARSQLQTYGRWLRGAREALDWPGSIVLLTHATPPPDDFNSQNIGTYGAVPHVCHWSAVHAWLKAFVANEMSAGRTAGASIFLGTELLTFLEMKGLIVPSLTFGDVDALGTYLASQAALQAAFQATLAAVRTAYPGIMSGETRAKAYKLEKRAPVYYGWTFLESGNLSDTTFFGWGLRFPNLTSWWQDFQAHLPDDTHFFCYFGCDQHTFSLYDVPNELIPAGWIIVDEGKHLLKPAPLTGLPAAATLQEAFAAWVPSQLGELQPVIAYIASLPTA